MNKILLKFYLSCLLSSWGDRLWSFALSIYFVTINKNSLLMTAINGLTCNIFSIVFGPILGGLVDKYQRIKVVRYALFIQNFTVALTCGLVVIVMIFDKYTETAWDGWFFYVIQVVMITFNVISRLASTSTKIAVERDWVVVIAEHFNHDKNDDNDGDEQINENNRSKKLTIINSTVRRIDLSTNVIAPLAAGLIMSFLNIQYFLNGTVLSAIFFAIWNIISYFIEYYLLSNVYKSIPKLKKTKLERKIEKNKSGLCKNVTKTIKLTKKGWLIYFKQGPIVMPSLSLALLFLTVLAFDSVTIGYAKYQKLKEFTISVMQAIGSITGILGTIAFPILHNNLKIRLETVGIIGNISQLVFLFGCLASIFLPGSPFSLANEWIWQNSTCSSLNHSDFSNTQNYTETFWSWNTFVESDCHVYVSIFVLLGCMAFSRFGLWLSDLVIHQIFQENIKENERGVVGGVQSSINMIFDLFKYILVILMPDIKQFGYLVIISVSAVFISFCLFASYATIKCCSTQDDIQKSENNKESKIRKSMIKFSANEQIQINESDSDSSFDDENEKLNKTVNIN